MTEPRAWWRMELPDPEAARLLALALLAVPPQDQWPCRLDVVAAEVAPGYVPGVAVGEPLQGSVQLTPWLWWLPALGRVVLELELDQLPPVSLPHVST